LLDVVLGAVTGTATAVSDTAFNGDTSTFAIGARAAALSPFTPRARVTFSTFTSPPFGTWSEYVTFPDGSVILYSVSDLTA
jgi:hypothetical protein